jgi:hypothetical protein
VPELADPDDPVVSDDEDLEEVCGDLPRPGGPGDQLARAVREVYAGFVARYGAGAPGPRERWAAAVAFDRTFSRLQARVIRRWAALTGLDPDDFPFNEEFLRWGCLILMDRPPRPDSHLPSGPDSAA